MYNANLRFVVYLLLKTPSVTERKKTKKAINFLRKSSKENREKCCLSFSNIT